MKKVNLYQEIAFDDNKPLITVLFETEFTKEIRIVMKESTVMKKHKSKFPIVIQLLEGSIDFGTSDEIHKLKTGDIIALKGNIPHNLVATKNSIIRLSLTKYDNTERVNNVIKYN